MATKIMQRGAKNYRDLVREGVADGSLRDEDGVMLFIAVVALSSYFPSAKALYETSAGKKVSQKTMTEKYSDFVTRLLSRSMAVRPAASSPLPTTGSTPARKTRKVARS